MRNIKRTVWCSLQTLSLVLSCAEVAVASVAASGPSGDISKPREISDLDVGDFSDNMESGSLLNLRKLGPGAFEFELQDRAIHGVQGSLMVWFYGQCSLKGLRVQDGERLSMSIRGPNSLAHVRPVYSYDGESLMYVPEGWGQRGDRFRFEVPLKPGETTVHFAAHYPYPPHRVLTRASELSKNPHVRACTIAGRTERGRPILLLTVTDSQTPGQDKRRILLSSGMHGGETASLWGIDGAVDFLISSKPEAEELRRRAVFHVVPISNMDAFALGLDRRQATGVNIYFDFARQESAEARVLWDVLKTTRSQIWLDFHSWHLGKAEGLYGPDPKVVGNDKYATLDPLIRAVGKHFSINHRGADELECSSTQALLKLGVLGFSPEFNMGQGADGKWKTIDDQKRLGEHVLMGLLDYLRTTSR